MRGPGFTILHDDVGLRVARQLRFERLKLIADLLHFVGERFVARQVRTAVVEEVVGDDRVLTLGALAG